MRAAGRIVMTVMFTGVSLAAYTGELPRVLGLLDTDHWEDVERGEAVVTILPAAAGELAVGGAVRVDAAPERLAAWTRRPERFYAGKYTPAIRRFSNPPRLEDLAGLVLPDEDLEALRRCRPRHCDVKLSGAEMSELHEVIGRSGGVWKQAATEAFRRTMLGRAETYLALGHGALPAYEDQDDPVRPGDQFEAIAGSMPVTPAHTRALAYFRAHRGAEADGVESHLYWSVEAFGSSKPVVSITHAAIFRAADGGAPFVLVAATQVYATHYLTGSVSFTELGDWRNGQPYLVYERRSRADVLRGAFGGIVRRIVQRRLAAEAPGVLDGIRRRLESGDPADAD